MTNWGLTERAAPVAASVAGFERVRVPAPTARMWVSAGMSSPVIGWPTAKAPLEVTTELTVGELLVRLPVAATVASSGSLNSPLKVPSGSNSWIRP